MGRPDIFFVYRSGLWNRGGTRRCVSPGLSDGEQRSPAILAIKQAEDDFQHDRTPLSYRGQSSVFMFQESFVGAGKWFRHPRGVQLYSARTTKAKATIPHDRERRGSGKLSRASRPVVTFRESVWIIKIRTRSSGPIRLGRFK